MWNCYIELSLYYRSLAQSWLWLVLNFFFLSMFCFRTYTVSRSINIRRCMHTIEALSLCRHLWAAISTAFVHTAPDNSVSKTLCSDHHLHYCWRCTSCRNTPPLFVISPSKDLGRDHSPSRVSFQNLKSNSTLTWMLHIKMSMCLKIFPRHLWHQWFNCSECQ